VDDLNANPHGATMEFEGARASGFTGCNRWFASIAQHGEQLRFGAVGTTRMACQAEVQAATERNFLVALDATRVARTEDGELVFYDSAGVEAARFRREN
jgi:heat shock protein HslJ